jgi:hypothetical protein
MLNPINNIVSVYKQIDVINTEEMKMLGLIKRNSTFQNQITNPN